MILVDTALARREEEGRPIRVALVGAGFQGAAIVRQIVTATKGMRIAGVANRHLDPAIRAMTDVGIEPVVRMGRAAIEVAAGLPVGILHALRRGRRAP